ncbi:dUTP diphosphatase [Sulfurovum sp. zt1-1]|uniref:dUTP diphosphatase n=1 Tax=Sulfurovum zhangzhouensis TaxID=3019067 RepID=A0ABT7QVR5_9BACT|nr:dUTP diphosphatase [Sulfurovum zhangzhouensis]MDM5270935.1 dUTP diphosphatase [Sulfurovum zhangzhouensis]
MDKILQMLKLQQQLNDATNGEGWEQGITKNGKLIDWKRCTYLECAELIESYPWKHWKNIDAEPDHANIKIEAVDIWHFIMSQGLEDYKIQNLGSIEKLAEDINALPNFVSFDADIVPTEKNHYEQIETVEELMRVIFCNEGTQKMMESFIDVAIQSELNLDSLYQLYVGKNILNQFRQDHGYKDGTYIKMWNGVEDNVQMQYILDTNDEISPEELYRALEEAYPKG